MTVYLINATGAGLFRGGQLGFPSQCPGEELVRFLLRVDAEIGQQPLDGVDKFRFVVISGKLARRIAQAEHHAADTAPDRARPAKPARGSFPRGRA